MTTGFQRGQGRDDTPVPLVAPAALAGRNIGGARTGLGRSRPDTVDAVAHGGRAAGWDPSGVTRFTT